MAKRVPDFLSTLWIVAIALLACAVLAGACSRRQTVASKSAAAYDEAVEKGLPIGSGHGGHRHGAVGSPSGEETPDAAANPMSGMDHVDHSPSAGADDHSMTGIDASKIDGRDRGSVPAMDHSSMAGHDRAARANGDHSKVDGEHSKMTGSGKHPTAETEHFEKTAPDSSSNAEIVELDPAATLRQDGLDAPAPRSVSEAQKAGVAAHSDHGGAKDAPADLAPGAPTSNDHHAAPPAPEGER
jgi:hypothetical protein